MSVHSITFFEDRRYLVQVLEILIGFDPFLSFLTIFGKSFSKHFDAFLEFLHRCWLVSSTIMVNVDRKSEFLSEEETCRRSSGGCLVDCAVGE